MLLSVIIPVYNVAPYLRRCVDSVLNQTYKDLEIILVDDGSTDESGALCDKIAEEIRVKSEEVRVKVIHKPNGGLSDARNSGLKVATGEYVAFLDADDIWLQPDGIEQMMKRIEENESDIMLFKRVDIYPNRKYYQADYHTEFIRSHSAQEVFENLMLSERFCMSACFQLLRRKLLIDNSLFFPVGYISEDVDFSCRLWQCAKVVDAINLDMYGYCHRENSITTSYSIRVLQSYDKMFTYWGEQVKNKCINHYAIGAFMANLFVSCSYNYFSIAKQDRKKAMQILLGHQSRLHYAASKKSLRMKKVVAHIGIIQAILIFATYGKLKKIYQSIAL